MNVYKQLRPGEWDREGEEEKEGKEEEIMINTVNKNKVKSGLGDSTVSLEDIHRRETKARAVST